MKIDTTNVKRIVVEMMDGSEQVKDIKTPIKLRPDIGDDYWFIHNHGDVIQTGCDNDAVDNHRWNTGNGFFTKEEAELAKKRSELDQSYRDFIAEINHREGWVCDWSDEAQEKMHLKSFDRTGKRTHFRFSRLTQNIPTAYYLKPELVDEVRAKFSDEQLVLIHLGVEL